MKRRHCFFTLLLLLLSACRTETPPPQPIMHTESVYELEIHTFQVAETDATFVFHKGKALLIDCSTNADVELLKAYLAAHAVSEPAFILSASENAVHIPCDAAYTVETLPEVGLSFGDSRIIALEGAHGAAVQLLYKGSTFRFPLSQQTPSTDTVESAHVTIIKPAADGVQSQMQQKSLQEILG